MIEEVICTLIKDTVSRESKKHETSPILDHEHTSEKQARWFADKLEYLEMAHKAAEDLFFLNRWRYNRIQEKRSSCKECCKIIDKAYYRR